MILESAQVSCTVFNQQAVKTPYHSTQLNHHRTIWTGESKSNWLGLKDLANSMNEAFRFQFDKFSKHLLMDVVDELTLPKITEDGLTSFVQAIQDYYIVPGAAVQTYRKFSIYDKKRFGA